MMGSKQDKHPCPYPFVGLLTTELITHQDQQGFRKRDFMLNVKCLVS